MSNPDDIEPCALSLLPKRSWLPKSPRRLVIDGVPTEAKMTANSAQLFRSRAVEGALVGSSKSHGYWIFEAHGFKAPLGTEIAEIANAFDRHERDRSNVAVTFG